MRNIIFAIWSLAMLAVGYLAGSTTPLVHAADLAGDNCNYNIRDSHGRIIGVTTMDCGIPVDVKPDALVCLAKMEAAMRVMEPFVSRTPDPFGVIVDDLTVKHRTEQGELREAIMRLDQRDAAWSQWQAVKHECWTGGS